MVCSKKYKFVSVFPSEILRTAEIECKVIKKLDIALNKKKWW